MVAVMANHSILGNILCPACGSDDFELIETTSDQSINYACNDCGMFWKSDDSFEEPKPLKF